MNIKKVFHNLDYLIAGIALFILILITFLGVIMRYVFNSPIQSLQELQMFCAIWLVFFGGSVAVRTNGIVSIDFIVNKFPPKIRKGFDIGIHFLVIFVLLFLGINGVRQLFFLARTERVSFVLSIPYQIIYFAFPVGMFSMAGCYIFQLVKLLNTHKKEKVGR